MDELTRRSFFRQLAGGFKTPARELGRLMGETLGVFDELSAAANATAEQAGLELSKASSHNSLIDTIRNIRCSGSHFQPPIVDPIPPGRKAGDGADGAAR